MGGMAFKIHYVVFIIMLSMQEGLSARYEAHFDDKQIFLQRIKRQSKPAKPVIKVTEYHVRCSVMSRYASTTVASSVWNQLTLTKEAAFEVDLPSSAFISNFTMTSNGKVYVAKVTERTAARKIYDAAKKQGKTAGLVATKEREIERFRVAVSVPPGARMSFSLTYEELLPRRLGRYELTLGLRPGQLVQNLTLDVSIAERTGISFLNVLPLKTSRLLSNTVQGDSGPPASTQIQQNYNCARVRYSPSQLQQSGLSPKGLNADFIIQYDVELRDLIGDIQVYDGYFVHYFAPRGLPVVPKDVIFVIDVSGSMTGAKIKQTKQAMGIILGDLREGDHFNIITFSDKVHTWKKGRTVRATRQNVKDAKDFVKRINAEGWTNINAALLSAAQLVNPFPSSSSRSSSSSGGARRVPLVIFLTDGEATIGVTIGDTILSNAKKALGSSASLFGLAFGDDADLPLLKRLALENRGVARMVFEDADAALQLKGFYDEVASPLLSDVQLSYLDERAFDVTRSLFPNYFQGSELVVTGKVKPGVKDLKVSLSAVDSQQKVTVENEVPVPSWNVTSTTKEGCSGGIEGAPSSFVRRLWAYFTIKELLQAKLNSNDSAMQRLLTEKATNLSLKYNFVTPVTSLVVVKPDADEPTPTTVPSTTTTIAGPTTTTTAIPPTALAPPSKTAARKFNSSSSTRANRVKPGRSVAKPRTPQPPPARSSIIPQTKTLPAPTSGKSVPPSSTKKTTTTSTPSSDKTAPAPIAGNAPTPPPSAPKTAPVPAGKISTFLSNLFKVVPPPGPGKISTPPPIITMKAIPSSTVKTSTTLKSSFPAPHPDSAQTDPTPQPNRFLTPETNSIRTILPTLRVSFLPSITENHTVGVTEASHPFVTTLLQGLLPPLTTTAITPTTAPALALPLEDNEVDSDQEISIATLVAATFAPMPGFTDGPKPWEAAGLLDVSTSIQIQRKDIDLVKDFDVTYDYDYDLNYDSWGQTADTESFDPPSRLSTVRVFSSSVDGDPHFVLQLPKLHQSLCFTVDGRANDMLRLLEDPERGIRVDGHLVGAPSKEGVEERSRTFFDQLTISSTVDNPHSIVITLSLDTVVLEGEGLDTLSTKQQGSVTRQGVKVAMDNHGSCLIELANDVRFLVLFHQYKHPSYLQMAHLGFYIVDGQGLSSATQGLLGQFQHADMTVTEVNHHPTTGAHQSSKEDILARGLLRWGSVQMRVMLQDKTLKDTVRKRHQGRCWVVPKADVEKLLGHPYQSFVVAHW